MKKPYKLFHGDSEQVLAHSLLDNMVDSCVCDCPYANKFMKSVKKWDITPSVDLWKEVYRVLKPGAHLLAMGGTRTYHKLAMNIEDAGFEIRDVITWLYGSGFPKSHNISKAMDKMQGAKRGKLQARTGYKNNVNHSGGDYTGEFPDNEPITPEAKQWDGWGTALKPACELIVMARKPFKQSVAKNMLKHGTGGINIDACKVKTEIGNKSRFPANLILDEESAKLLDKQSGNTSKTGNRSIKSKNNNQDSGNPFSAKGNLKNCEYTDSGGASRFFYCAKASKAERNVGLDDMPEVECKTGCGGKMPIDDNGKQRDRFRKVARNHHPTVKPIKLMEYLVKLVTPPNGLVLDPFMGSGSTGVACVRNDFRFIGIEIGDDYFNIASKRIKHHKEEKNIVKD